MKIPQIKNYSWKIFYKKYKKNILFKIHLYCYFYIFVDIHLRDMAMQHIVCLNVCQCCRYTYAHGVTNSMII